MEETICVIGSRIVRPGKTICSQTEELESRR